MTISFVAAYCKTIINTGKQQQIRRKVKNKMETKTWYALKESSKVILVLYLMVTVREKKKCCLKWKQ
ncbi:hypothetical protein TNCT_517291 [Trichonephila clavata]|uniref:Uncharacterized protein n=1 Tax=Trichonephila clavata TaxID=2740835 RepID=A0A8X6FGF6_TRICU|nr:hypothetical protein TNCT_517291 [Trichonephila clavata]